MKELTARQKEVLLFISEFYETNSYAPTVREISEYFHVTVGAIQDHIIALRKKGYLSDSQNKSRVMKIVLDENEIGKTFIGKVPLLGTIAAGKPLLCEENLDGYVNLTEPFVRSGKNYFALRVRGASMQGAGILEGDLAIIEQRQEALDGQIVVAVIDDAITLKRYYKESNRVRLQPENPDFQAIYCQDVKIVGVLSNIVRTY